MSEQRRIPRHYDLETLRKALETTQHNPEEAKRVALDIVAHMLRDDESHNELKSIVKDAVKDIIEETRSNIVHKISGWIFAGAIILIMYGFIWMGGFKRNY